MFGRAVAIAASVCALCSLLVAGEAGAQRTGVRRPVRLHVNNNLDVSVRPSSHRLPEWPPLLHNPQRSATRRHDASGAGRFGDAFMVDTAVIAVPAGGSQYSCGVASNGDGWRVIWSDYEDLTVRTTGITADGDLLDSSGTLIDDDGYSSAGLNRSIVGTGSGFFAVWSSGDFGIRGAVLDSVGAPAQPFLIFRSDDGQNGPAVAFDGDSTSLVVWTENPNGISDIYAARVTTGGQVLDTVPIRVAEDGGWVEILPEVAFGRGAYLVVWTAIDSTYTSAVVKARRLLPDGTMPDTAMPMYHDPAMMQAYAAVGFGDTCFLATWSEGMEQVDVYAARISASGSLLDSAGVQLCSSPDLDIFSSIGFDGTNYLVMWVQMDTSWASGSMCGRRVTADGAPLDSGLLRPDLPGFIPEFPSVAADQTSFLVAFSAYETVNYEDNVFCARVSADGEVLDPVLTFPVGADAQYGASGASDGTGFLAAWMESRGQGDAVQAARIAADGSMLDSVGIAVNDGAGYKYSLSTIYGDSMYLVAWADYRTGEGPDIYCARVTADGQVLDPDGIIVSAAEYNQEYPDVSFDGENFLVVWQDDRNASFLNIYGARVSPAGAVLDPGGIVVAADTFGDQHPSVSFAGGDHLVVWEGNHSGEVDIYGAMVSPGGIVTKPRFLVSGATGEQSSPVVACGSTNSLVVWQDSRFSDYDIFAARVGADGTVLDTSGIMVTGTSSFDRMPRVTADEVGFRVAWFRSNTGAVARIDTSGDVVRTSDWFDVSNPDQGYDIVQGGGPELLALFSNWTDSSAGRYYGADRLWGKLDLVPGIEQGDDRPLKEVTGEASVVRSVLFLPRSLDPSIPRPLLDITGRKVLDLKPGANDVHDVAPGVYFVRASEAGAEAVRKVVVTR
jgi:hypothetical protein